ncbi:hypothetical protein TCAP_03566, partial [Tolypocladium capitatum]
MERWLWTRTADGGDGGGGKRRRAGMGLCSSTRQPTTTRTMPRSGRGEGARYRSPAGCSASGSGFTRTTARQGRGPIGDRRWTDQRRCATTLIQDMLDVLSGTPFLRQTTPRHERTMLENVAGTRSARRLHDCISQDLASLRRLWRCRHARHAGQRHPGLDRRNRQLSGIGPRDGSRRLAGLDRIQHKLKLRVVASGHEMRSSPGGP